MEGIPKKDKVEGRDTFPRCHANNQRQASADGSEILGKAVIFVKSPILCKKTMIEKKYIRLAKRVRKLNFATLRCKKQNSMVNKR